MTKLPPHLGGSGGLTLLDAGALDALTAMFAPRSFLDIGCGPGGMLELATARGMVAEGIDADPTLDYSGLSVIQHDFTLGPVNVRQAFDLGWCVEVLEHVEERFLPNLWSAFVVCKRLWITHALPGQHGWHHVNCRPPEYWRAVLAGWGFAVNDQVTRRIRAASSMREDYARRTGLLIERVS